MNSRGRISDSELGSLKTLLGSNFDLRQKFEIGKDSFYRLWQTVELFDPFGELVHRNQWRGDFRRVVEAANTTGNFDESITWHSVGLRYWLPDNSGYTPPKELAFARNFSYRISIEGDYKDLNWDYSTIPKSLEGVIFRQAFQVSAHFEFDFMRSTRHAAVDRLTKIGDLNLSPPEEGKSFSLSFPPMVTNSVLKRKNVHLGFLGLTLCQEEPCALIYFRQGPQQFSWDGIENPDPTSESASPDNLWHKELKSWQQGHFCVRLSDGNLAEGEFLENHMIKRSRPNGDEVGPAYSRGIWSIREISREEFDLGLQDWHNDQSELPWHCLFNEFRERQ